MAVNKRKVLEAARKHATKGAKEKALKEYDKLLKLDPRDAKLRLEIGDAHRRWGQTAEAAEVYSKVAEQFMKEGFDARAVAVYKQILNLDSDSLTCYEPLAELYQRMGLTVEATAALQTAADGYHRAGDKTAALGLLRKMAMLEPSNTTSRLKVADLLQKEEMNDEAIVEYEAVVEELLVQGDAEGVATVYERLLEVDPDRVLSLTGYARNLIDRGSADRAEPFAKRALEADKSPEQYELLGEVLRAGGRDDELIALYRDLAEVYRQRGDEERTREILQRYVPPEEFSTTGEPNGYLDESELSPKNSETPLEPDDPDTLDEFDELGPLEDDDRDGFGDENSLLDEDLMADDSQLLGDGESGMGIITDLDTGGERPIFDPSPGDDLSEMTRLIPEDAAPVSVDVEQLFAEASVYLRYGKRDQAVANLENVLEVDPTHRGALEKLGEAFVEANDKARAAEVWSRAAKLALEDGEIESARAIRDRIESIDAAAASELVLDMPVSHSGDPDTEESPIPDDLLTDPADDGFGESLPDIDTPASSDSELQEIEFDDIEIDVDDASFTLDPNAAEPQAEVTASDSPLGQSSEAMTLDGSVEPESNPKQVGEDLEEADFYLEQGLLDEAEEIYTRVLETAPSHPHALVRMGEVAAQRGEDPGSSAARVEIRVETDVPAEPVERDVPDEPDSMDIGEELADWDDDLSLTDELDIGPPAEDMAGSETFDPEIEEPIDEEELSVADLSVGAFAPIDASSEETGDTRDLPGDLAGDLAGDAFDAVKPELDESAQPVDAAFDDDIDVALDDDIDVDFELDETDEQSEDVAEQSPAPELSVEAPVDHSDEPGDERTSDETTQDSTGPELAVTSIDFGDDTGDDVGGDDAEAEPEGEGFGFDLAAEIGQALGEDPNESTSGNSADTSDDGFAAVFAEFKKGVSETLSEGDFEAHYDLGIAYREMGLLDDAMVEFQAAMGSPSRKLGCLHLLGLCALDSERLEDATAHRQMALDTDGLASEQILAIRFDLGRCFERSGDIESAKAEYIAVQSENPAFGDVGARLEGLGDPDKQAEDETHYESFDDFFNDSDEDEEGADVDDSDDEDDDDESDGSGLESERYEGFDDDVPQFAGAGAPEVAAEVAHDHSIEEDGVAEVVLMDAIVGSETEATPMTDLEVEPALEIEPEPEVGSIIDEVEPAAELELELEPESEPAKARKKRKISFF